MEIDALYTAQTTNDMTMKRLIHVIVLVSTVLLASCSIYSRHRYETNPLVGSSKMTDPTTGKEVVLIPMRHLSTAGSYAKVRDYIDILKADGYVTFCEGVMRVPYHMDTVREISMAELYRFCDTVTFTAAELQRLDTIIRKDRRIMGSYIGKGGYADPDNQSLPERNKKQKYVSQTLELLGLTTDKDIWIDYSIYDMMGLYEKRYGEVELSEYDFATGLMERYEPIDDKPSTTGMLRLVLYPRNEYVVRRIIGSQRPRIAVIYGSGHMPGIKYYLKKHGFRQTRGYKADKQPK